MKIRCVTIAALLLMCGCATVKPPHYFTLDMHPAMQAAPAVNLSLDQIRVSEALGRKDILIQHSPTQIEYYAKDQWAGGLAEMVTQKLRAEWGAPQAGHRNLVVSGTLLAFQQQDAGTGAQGFMSLAAAFRKEGASRYQKPLFEKTYTATLPAADASAKSVVDALSRCVEKIAAEMAEDTARLP